MTKRSKEKHSALKKQFNLKSRQDLIDFDYLDQLDESELDFLNDFVSETVNANFTHDPELKRLSLIIKEVINCPEVQELSERIRIAKTCLSEALSSEEKGLLEVEIESLTKQRRELKIANKRSNREVIKGIEKQLQKRREETLIYPKKKQHKEFYDENNSRNNDLYNTASRTGSLFQLEPQQFDTYFINSRNLDFESHRLDILDNAELEIKEAVIYEKLKRLGSIKSGKYVRQLDKCKTHEELVFLLEEIEHELRQQQPLQARPEPERRWLRRRWLWLGFFWF